MSVLGCHLGGLGKGTLSHKGKIQDFRVQQQLQAQAVGKDKREHTYA